MITPEQYSFVSHYILRHVMVTHSTIMRKRKQAPCIAHFSCMYFYPLLLDNGMERTKNAVQQQ